MNIDPVKQGTGNPGEVSFDDPGSATALLLRMIIKSAGANVGTATLIEYFTYLEEGFLAFSITNYKAKFSERESKKKFYFNNNGMLNLFLLQPETKLLEHLYLTI